MSENVKVYLDHAGEWRWTAYVNGEPVADSNEGYTHKDHAVAMAKSRNPNGELEIEDDE